MHTDGSSQPPRSLDDVAERRLDDEPEMLLPVRRRPERQLRREAGHAPPAPHFIPRASSSPETLAPAWAGDLSEMLQAPRRVAIDLSRFSPGGVNGGAKLMTLQLIRQMARRAPHWEFVLLTSARVHHELATLECANVTRHCLEQTPSGHPVDAPLPAGRLTRAVEYLKRHPALTPLRLANSYLFRRPRRLRCLAQRQIDVIFFPLTSPQFYEPGVASVAIVYDLQHLTYPQFFSFDDRLQRSQHLARAARMTNRIVCISDYSRQRLLAHTSIAAEHVERIYIGLEKQLSIASATEQAVLQRYALAPGRYYLYPANTWEHKNHRRLFDGFARYVARNPHDPVRLVCTGADTGRLPGLQQLLGRLNVGQHVLMTGYLDASELAALYQNARALLFPSLYEGFGMPVAEAMSRGLPVLCSNVTSLPEIAGSAALYFDPQSPQEIALAMERLQAMPEVRQRLIAAGYEQVARLGTAETMAIRYLETLATAVPRSQQPGTIAVRRRPHAVPSAA